MGFLTLTHADYSDPHETHTYGTAVPDRDATFQKYTFLLLCMSVLGWFERSTGPVLLLLPPMLKFECRTSAFGPVADSRHRVTRRGKPPNTHVAPMCLAALARKGSSSRVSKRASPPPCAMGLTRVVRQCFSKTLLGFLLSDKQSDETVILSRNTQGLGSRH